MDDLHTRQAYLRQMGALQTERSSWVGRWRETADYLLPNRGRFIVTDNNRGQRRDSLIINNVGPVGMRTISAGMMSGITNPSRMWADITLDDDDLAEYEPVKEWIEVVKSRMFKIFAQSNLYNTLQIGYSDLAGFGTHCAVVESDLNKIIRLYTPPMGRYFLATSDTLEVDTMFEETCISVKQTVEKFGYDVCSDWIKVAWDRGDYYKQVYIVRLIQPNRDYDERYADRHGMPYAACWFEKGAGSAQDYVSAAALGDSRFLDEGGYREFPVLAPRWSVCGTDVYGTDSPGELILGDVRSLQKYEIRGAEVFDKIARPPMVASSANRNSRLTMVAGEVSYVDGFGGQGRPFQPAYEINPVALREGREEKAAIIQRIREGSFADLFLMLANSTQQGDMTAREVAERHEEKLLALGPVLERVTGEYLSPLVTRTLAEAMRRRVIPPPPPELAGQAYRVTFISVLAQAQKLLGVTSNDRAWQFALNVAQAKPEILDIFNVDKFAYDQFDRLGVSPAVLNSEDEIKALRDQRAKAQQAAQQQQQMMAMTEGAKNLGQAQTTPDTALGQIANAIGGPAAVGTVSEGA